MEDETTIATPEYLAARAQRLTEYHRQIYSPVPRPTHDVPLVEYEAMRKEVLRDLDMIRVDVNTLRDALEVEHKEMRYLAWQNEELKRQIATLKGEAGK